jgi:cobalamin biosynthesis protein CbiD
MGSSGIANPYCDEESKNQIKNALVALYGFL